MRTIAVKAIGSRRNIVSHSNQLTEARYTLTVAEQRLVITLLSLISPYDEDFKDYEIKISDFKNLLGINTNAVYDQVKEVLKKIAGRVLHIPTENGYIITHWFSSAEYNSKNGSVQISLDKKLKPYLLQLKEQFTRYRLFIITQFQSSYTVRIYMLLKQYEVVGYREIDVSELREILDIDEKKYPLFKDFRKWVLNKVKKELETKNKGTGGYNSDITFDLETIRTGRRITRLRFIIKKQSYQEMLPLDLPETEEKLPIISALEKYGISEIVAKRFIEEQGEEDILRCISLYEEKLQLGKVKDTSGGYLITMLKAEAGKMTEAEKQTEQKKKEKTEVRKQAKKQKILEEKKQKLEKEFRIKAVAEYIATLSENEASDLLEQARSESPLLRNTITSLDSSMCLGFLLPKIPDYAKNQKAYVQEKMK